MSDEPDGPDGPDDVELPDPAGDTLVEAGPIDPKIQARRDQVQYERNRQRGRRFLAVAIAGAVLAAGFWMFRSPFLDVDTIEVTGAERTGVEAVRDASAVHHGDRLSTVPLSEVAARVQDAMIDRDFRKKREGRTPSDHAPVIIDLD